MAFTVFPFEQDSWTIETLAQRPDDDRRYEIVDGQLIMMAKVSMGHQAVVSRLRDVLRDAFGDEFLVWENLAVNLAPTWRIPDLTVFRASAFAETRLDVLPADIALAVEVVSPSSRTNDRITKPAQYAAAGIKAYWRVETGNGCSLTAYALQDGDSTYTELGTWAEGEVAALAEPVEVQIDVAALKL